eukprot:COSAG01_NODE_4372_length_5087_cov_39.002406_2_plen_196_part_00
MNVCMMYVCEDVAALPRFTASTWAHLSQASDLQADSSDLFHFKPSHNVLASSALQLCVAREMRACVGRAQHPANGGGRRARRTKCVPREPRSSTQALRLAGGAAVKVDRLSTKYVHSDDRPASRGLRWPKQVSSPNINRAAARLPERLLKGLDCLLVEAYVVQQHLLHLLLRRVCGQRHRERSRRPGVCVAYDTL